MSNFKCNKCGTEILDSPNGYLTGCKHHPHKIIAGKPENYTDNSYTSHANSRHNCEKVLETKFKIQPYYISVVKLKKQWYWTISRNGEILAHSEQYSSRVKARKTAKHLFERMQAG